jgi:uncharacterized protein YutE (UPF0331/DUF86 family)
MPDDILLNKVAIIERCVARVRAVYGGDSANLLDHLTLQDSILLNLQRACEAAIDLAMHLVSARRLGIPQESREAFDLLREAGLLSPQLSETMRRMVGFRNVAVHDYRKLDLAIVQSILDRHLDDFLAFARRALSLPAES